MTSSTNETTNLLNDRDNFDLMQQLRFSGLDNRNTLKLFHEEMKRLLAVSELALKTEEKNIQEFALLEMKLLTDACQNKLFPYTVKSMEEMANKLAGHELKDLVEGESGRDRQQQFLNDLGLRYHTQRIGTGEGNPTLYRFLADGRQIDREGRTFENFEMLPSVFRTLPRISRSIVG